MIIPAFNEAPVIASTIAGVQAQLQEPPLNDLTSTLLVVDDGSTDSTSQIANQPGVTVLRHPTNLGLGAALSTGLQAARQDGVTLAVTFDADGQHNPRDLPKVLAPLLEGSVDLAIGSRLLCDASRASIPPARRLILWAANLLTWLLYGVWTTDSQSGLRALNRRALEQIEVCTQRMEVSSEIFAEVKRLGLRTAEVPIEAIYTDYSRHKGQTFWNGFHIVYKLLLRQARRRKPKRQENYEHRTGRHTENTG